MKTRVKIAGLVAFGAMGFWMSAAPAQEADQPLDPILACQGVSDPQERLACFDAAATTLSGQVEAGEVAAVNRADVEAVEGESFGLRLPSLPRLSISAFQSGQEHAALAAPSGAEDGEAGAQSAAADEAVDEAAEVSGVRIVERAEDGQVDRVLMTIAEVRVVGYDTHLFEMTNGQVWRQRDTGRVRVPRGGPHTAEIRRAALGSYFLRINGEGRAIRVRRDD